MLSTAISNDDKSWDLQLPTIMLAYRTSVQETTGVSPYFLMFGRDPLLPIDIEFNLPFEETYTGTEVYREKLQERLNNAYQIVRQHIQHEQRRHKDLYDQSVCGAPYAPGDKVWLHCSAVPRARCRKFHCPWKGPYTILKQIGSVCYRIRDDQHPRRRIVVHFNRLKPYFEPPNEYLESMKKLINQTMVLATPVPVKMPQIQRKIPANKDTERDSDESNSTPSEGPSSQPDESPPSQLPVLRRSSRMR